MNMRALLTRRTLLYGAVALVAIGAFTYGMHALSKQALDQILFSDLALRHYIHSHRIISSIVFCLVFLVIATISLPLESILSVVAGYFFGAVLGTVLAVFSATAGSTIMLLLAKNYLHDWFHDRFQSPVVKRITSGVHRDAFSYVLFLRLIAIFPNLLVNVGLGLSNVRTRDFVFGTFIGIIPITTIFVLAGTQLETIRRTGQLLTPETVGILALLGMFSLIPIFWRFGSSRRGSGTVSENDSPFTIDEIDNNEIEEGNA